MLCERHTHTHTHTHTHLLREIIHKTNSSASSLSIIEEKLSSFCGQTRKLASFLLRLSLKREEESVRIWWRAECHDLFKETLSLLCVYLSVQERLECVCVQEAYLRQSSCSCGSSVVVRLRKRCLLFMCVVVVCVSSGREWYCCWSVCVCVCVCVCDDRKRSTLSCQFLGFYTHPKHFFCVCVCARAHGGGNKHSRPSHFRAKSTHAKRKEAYKEREREREREGQRETRDRESRCSCCSEKEGFIITDERRRRSGTKLCLRRIEIFGRWGKTYLSNYINWLRFCVVRDRESREREDEKPVLSTKGREV